MLNVKGWLKIPLIFSPRRPPPPTTAFAPPPPGANTIRCCQRPRSCQRRSGRRCQVRKYIHFPPFQDMFEIQMRFHSQISLPRRWTPTRRTSGTGGTRESSGKYISSLHCPNIFFRKNIEEILFPGAHWSISKPLAQIIKNKFVYFLLAFRIFFKKNRLSLISNKLIKQCFFRAFSGLESLPSAASAQARSAWSAASEAINSSSGSEGEEDQKKESQEDKKEWRGS